MTLILFCIFLNFNYGTITNNSNRENAISNSLTKQMLQNIQTIITNKEIGVEYFQTEILHVKFVYTQL